MTQFRVLERMMQNSGAAGLFFTRFLPSLIKNYGMALLDVSPLSLVVACVLNIIPLSLMWALVGASASDLAALTAGPSVWDGVDPSTQRLVTVAMAVLAVALTAAARRAWNNAAAQVAASDAAAAARAKEDTQ